MKRILFGLTLASALCLPNALSAQNDRHDADKSSKTYYDTAHKDQHQWNDNESGAWNRYRNEHHVKQSDFAKASKKQQQEYWKYRHDHPDQR